MDIKWILVHVDENRLKQHLQRFFGNEFILQVDGGKDYIIHPSFINESKNPSYGTFFPYNMVLFKYCSLVDASIRLLGKLTKNVDIPEYDHLWGIELVNSGIDRSIISYGDSETILHPFQRPELQGIISALKERIYNELSSLWKVEVLQVNGEGSKSAQRSGTKDTPNQSLSGVESNASIKPYDIPKNIYSKDILSYEWLNDETRLKKIYKDYSIGTMNDVIKAINKGYENYQAMGGMWGPKKVAEILNKSPIVIGRYFKVLRELGVKQVDNRSLPIVNPKKK